MDVYRSIHHPRSRGRVAYFGQWLLNPLAMCMLPVMVVTLVAVLQNESIRLHLTYGFPGAFAIAAAWTAFRMRMTLAEVVLSGSLAEVRTVLDILRGVPARPSHPVLDVRKYPDHVQVAVGTSVYELSDADWPETTQMVAALVRARMGASRDASEVLPAVGQGP